MLTARNLALFVVASLSLSAGIGLADSLPEGALFRIGSTRLRYEGELEELRFAAGGATLFAASDRGARLFDVATGEVLAAFPLDTQLSEDGTTLAIILPDEGIELRSASGGELLARLQDLSATRILALSFDGKQLVLDRGVDESRWLRLEADGSFSEPMQATSVLTAAAFSPDGATLAGASSDTLALWSADGTLAKSIALSTQVVWLHFSPEGKALLASPLGRCCEDCSVWVSAYDVQELSLIVEDSNGFPEYSMPAVAFLPDADELRESFRKDPSKALARLPSDTTSIAASIVWRDVLVQGKWVAWNVEEDLRYGTMADFLGHDEHKLRNRQAIALADEGRKLIVQTPLQVWSTEDHRLLLDTDWTVPSFERAAASATRLALAFRNKITLVSLETGELLFADEEPFLTALALQESPPRLYASTRDDEVLRVSLAKDEATGLGTWLPSLALQVESTRNWIGSEDGLIVDEKRGVVRGWGFDGVVDLDLATGCVQGSLSIRTTDTLTTSARGSWWGRAEDGVVHLSSTLDEASLFTIEQGGDRISLAISADSPPWVAAFSYYHGSSNSSCSVDYYFDPMKIYKPGRKGASFDVTLLSGLPPDPEYPDEPLSFRDVETNLWGPPRVADAGWREDERGVDGLMFDKTKLLVVDEQVLLRIDIASERVEESVALDGPLRRLDLLGGEAVLVYADGRVDNVDGTPVLASTGSTVDDVVGAADGSVLASLQGDGTILVWKAPVSGLTERPARGRARLATNSGAPESLLIGGQTYQWGDCFVHELSLPDGSYKLQDGVTQAEWRYDDLVVPDDTELSVLPPKLVQIEVIGDAATAFDIDEQAFALPASGTMKLWVPSSFTFGSASEVIVEQLEDGTTRTETWPPSRFELHVRDTKTTIRVGPAIQSSVPK